MKKYKLPLLMSALFLIATLIFGFSSMRKTEEFTTSKNAEKTEIIQKRIDETIELLEELTENETIRSKQLSYTEKAQFLTDLNQDKGYVMIRILDEDINVYKEGVGLASNLASREYLQKLYATGEKQITDAFLAGADGKTINYTIAVAIKEEDKVTGALFAALYGKEIDEYLEDKKSVNILIGSQSQYMGGISAEKFGLATSQALETGMKTFVPVENILLDFQNKKSGKFWATKGVHLQCYVYTPIEQTNWIVMTEVSVFGQIKGMFISYIAFLIILISIIFYRKYRKMKA